MALSVVGAAKKLSKLRKDYKIKRFTLTGQFFRDIVKRGRIEDSFINSLNKVLVDDYQLIVNRLPGGVFLVVSTDHRFLVEDEYVQGEEN